MAVYSWLCARPSGMAAFNNSFGLMRIALEYVKDPAAWTDSYLNYVVVLIGLSFSLLFEVTSPRLFVYYISFLYIYIYTRSSTIQPLERIGAKNSIFDSSSMNDTITISHQIRRKIATTCGERVEWKSTPVKTEGRDACCRWYEGIYIFERTIQSKKGIEKGSWRSVGREKQARISITWKRNGR